MRKPLKYELFSVNNIFFFVGGLLLIANLSMRHFNPSMAFQVIGLVLIIIGIAIGRSLIYSFFISTVVAFFVMFAFFVSPQIDFQPITKAAKYQHVYPVKGIRTAEIDILTVATHLNVETSFASRNVIKAKIETNKAERFSPSFKLAHGLAQISLHSLKQRPWLTYSNNTEWNIKINPSVALKLKIVAGVGDVNLNLSGLSLKELDFKINSGITHITLPDSGTFNTKIQCGLGAIYIHVPKNLAVRIRTYDSISPISISDDFSFDKLENIYATAGYETAKEWVDIEIHNIHGSVFVDSI